MKETLIFTVTANKLSIEWSNDTSLQSSNDNNDNLILGYIILFIICFTVGIIINLIVILVHKFDYRRHFIATANFFENNTNNNNNINLMNGSNSNLKKLPLKMMTKENANIDNNPVVAAAAATKARRLNSSFKSQKSFRRNTSAGRTQTTPNDINTSPTIRKFKPNNSMIKRVELNRQNAARYSLTIDKEYSCLMSDGTPMRPGLLGIGGTSAHNLELTTHNNNVRVKGSNRRTLCSYFIFSLGCCDLFICAFIMPLHLLIQTGYYHAYISDLFESTLICKVVYFLIQIPITLEIELLLAIAIDRYSSVFRPIKLYFSDKKLSYRVLFILISFSALLSLPNIVFYFSVKQEQAVESVINIEQFPPISLSNYCTVRAAYVSLFSIYQDILLVLFVINVIIIIFCYGRVYRHVYKASKHQRMESVGNNSQRSSNATMNSININQYNNLIIQNSKRLLKNKKYRKEETKGDNKRNDDDDFDNKNTNETMNQLKMKKVQKDSSENVEKLSLFSSTPKLLSKKDKIKNQETNEQQQKNKINIPRQQRMRSNSENIQANSLTRFLSTNRRDPSNFNTPITSDTLANANTNNSASSQTNNLKIKCRRHTSPLNHIRTARILSIATVAFMIQWTIYWIYFIYLNKINNIGICKQEKSNFTSSQQFERWNETKTTTTTCTDHSHWSNSIWIRIFENFFFLNYILNPIIYSFVNKDFRNNVSNLLNKFSHKLIRICCFCCHWQVMKLFNISRNSNENIAVGQRRFASFSQQRNAPNPPI
jgi:hypothetical protein